MTSELHYKSNLRDVEFNLFEVQEIQRDVLGRGPFAEMDEATARETLRAYELFCRTELAKSYAQADREPLKLDVETGSVTLPSCLSETYQHWYDQGWNLLGLPTHMGGTGAPPSINWAAFEFGAGANANLMFYLFGAFLSRAIDELATPSQKARYVQNMIDRRWGGTMVLTEADAGSDVGSARAKARHLHDDVWEIEGVKRFITNGDFDTVENVVHLVLARPEGAGPGTKGLSLFIVPKFWVHEDGSLGERNGAYCTNIEKKMGIKGSATCEMTFGERIPARGLLVGEVHDGIRQMFRVIEHARMSVGIKSMATLSTGYLNALAYTRDRVQGGDLAQAMEKNSPRVRIIAHPDVRRMLMQQKSTAEGLRALAHFAASIQDRIELEGGAKAPSAKHLDRLNDLLLPMVKGYSSEKAFELLSVSLQCFGGSGYTQDYPMEQYMRDQRIDSLYEGTTHIQALDLLFRKIAKDNGATLQGLLGQIQATLDGNEGGDALANERAAVAKAVANTQAMLGALLGKMGESLYHVGLHGNRVLFALSETVIGWLLVRHAAIALSKRDGAHEDDKHFYDGKVASARFFCAEVLPMLQSSRKIVEQSVLDVMTLDERAFG
ncbi:MAG: acyl-CoA dehydrogenase [Deltaproteobacteria bacterium]|nr:acyl-CoA dehydrogenase [Deltaproteobacteria bacterium]